MWVYSQCGGERFFTNDLSKPKVCELDREILVCEKDIFGFDVAMDNIPLVLQKVSAVVIHWMR